MRRIAASRPLVFLVPLALLVGCSGGHDIAEKQLAELRSEVVKLRADQAAMAERMDGIELRTAAQRAQPADPKAPSDRPDLNVVRLTPEGGAADDPNSDAPRPVLRSTGRSAGVIEEPGGSSKQLGTEDAAAKPSAGKPGTGGVKPPAPAKPPAPPPAAPPKPPSSPPRSPTP